MCNFTDWFQGYATKQKVHPMYRTTNAEYGARAPSVHTMQTAYYSMSQEFSNVSGFKFSILIVVSLMYMPQEEEYLKQVYYNKN